MNSICLAFAGFGARKRPSVAKDFSVAIPCSPSLRSCNMTSCSPFFSPSASTRVVSETTFSTASLSAAASRSSHILKYDLRLLDISSLREVPLKRTRTVVPLQSKHIFPFPSALLRPISRTYSESASTRVRPGAAWELAAESSSAAEKISKNLFISGSVNSK